MSKNIFCLLLLLPLVIFSTCKKANEYPVEPVIAFKSLTIQKNTVTGFDEHATLAISFTDGDGDIGLETADTFPPFNLASPYHFNCITTGYRYNGTAWVEVILPPPAFNGRIGNITPDGKNKALKGDIEYFMFTIPGGHNQPVKFEMYIYDRALHRSNTITTPEIIVTTF